MSEKDLDTRFEEAVEIREKISNKKDIDEEMIQDAYRRLKKK